MFFFVIFLLVLTQCGFGHGKPAHSPFSGKNYEYLKQRFGLTEEELQRLVRTVKNELRQALDEKYDNELESFNYDDMSEMKTQRDGIANKFVDKNQIKKTDGLIIHDERKKDQKIGRQKEGPDFQKMSLGNAKPVQNKVFNGYKHREDNQSPHSQPTFENANRASKKSIGPLIVEAKSVKNTEEKHKPVRYDSMYFDEDSEDQPFSYYINPDIQDIHEQAKRDSQCSKVDISSAADVSKVQRNGVNTKRNTLHGLNSREVGDRKMFPEKGVLAPVKITKYVNNGGGYEEAGEYIVDLPAGLLNSAEKSEIQKLGENVKYDK